MTEALRDDIFPDSLHGDFQDSLQGGATVGLQLTWNIIQPLRNNNTRINSVFCMLNSKDTHYISFINSGFSCFS